LQLPLYQSLFNAYFSDGQDISSRETLARIAGSVGLSEENAYEVLSSNLYVNEVREREFYFISRGIHSVPAVVLKGGQVFTGAQSVDSYEQLLRQAASQR
jgi:predicted DsbA family dithiol-disulfide isomerase